MKGSKKTLASLIAGSALMLNSCGGGGGGSVVESPQPNPGDLLPSPQPETIETSDGVIVRAGNDKQSLEVFIPGAVLVNNSLSSNGYIRALALEDKGTAQEVKLPVGNESFSISFTDPDPYDTALMIGFKSQNKSIDFTGAYDSNKATLVIGNFDVFDRYFQVNKDNNNNKATLDLNFGNSLYSEGENDTITVGGWDYLNEGIKYSLPVRKDDLADVSLDSTNNNCPYDFDSVNKIIYLPTRDYGGGSYDPRHCVPFVITPGSDDSSDNDSTTVNVYEGSSTTPNATLVNNQVLSSSTSGVYNLTSNLSSGETRNLKVEVKANLNNDPNKLSSKIYNFTLKGDSSNIIVKVCLTADLNATSCTPGPNGDPYNDPIIANTYTWVGDVGNFAIYEDNDGNRIMSSGGLYVIPSTGAKVFFYVDKSNSTAENGRNYEFELWLNTPIKTYSTTDPLNFSEVYILG
ncbi:MAG TPA: hypothetical protein EYH54_02350, partial [Nautiliaceae bacterium]|nr:hypothetical protein [Nautiliaceae bacterium]